MGLLALCIALPLVFTVVPTLICWIIMHKWGRKVNWWGDDSDLEQGKSGKNERKDKRSTKGEDSDWDASMNVGGSEDLSEVLKDEEKDEEDGEKTDQLERVARGERTGGKGWWFWGRG